MIELLFPFEGLCPMPNVRSLGKGRATADQIDEAVAMKPCYLHLVDLGRRGIDRVHRKDGSRRRSVGRPGGSAARMGMAVAASDSQREARRGDRVRRAGNVV